MCKAYQQDSPVLSLLVTFSLQKCYLLSVYVVVDGNTSIKQIVFVWAERVIGCELPVSRHSSPDAQEHTTELLQSTKKQSL